VGQWHGIVSPPGGVQVETTFSLGSDKRVAAELTAGGRSVKAAGQWRVVLGKGTELPRLQVLWDTGHDPAVGEGVQWRIEKIEQDQLLLLGVNPDGSDAHEVYQRVKP